MVDLRRPGCRRFPRDGLGARHSDAAADDFAQAPPGAARNAVLALIDGAGLPADGVYVSRDPRSDVDVTGNARHAGMAITRGLWTTATPAEIRASVGHVMGHHAHNDMLSYAALLVLLWTAACLRSTACSGRWRA